jgi:rubrerythrin
MKRLIRTVVACTLALVFVTPVASVHVHANAHEIQPQEVLLHDVEMVVDGVRGQFTEDTKPFILEGRTYLPLRILGEKLGAYINYDDATHTVIVATVPSITARPTGGTTLENLLAAIEGETTAWASYVAYADVAEAEGFAEVARLFRATADAELQHADDQWVIAQSLGATQRPQAGEVNAGDTRQNLQSGINGETYEFAIMYPDFYQRAIADGETSTRRIFNYALRAEAVHSVNYTMVLDAMDSADFSDFAAVYRCPICGDVCFDLPDNCAICRTPGDQYIVY